MYFTTHYPGSKKQDNVTSDARQRKPSEFSLTHTAWKMYKYGVFCGPNTEKYGPEKTPHLDTFHALSTIV